MALVVALMASWYVVSLARRMPTYGTDFDPVRAGARLVLTGRDPYALIGPGRAVPWNYRLRYPLPAVLLGVPFVAVPVVIARVLFVAVTSGLLAFLITRRGWATVAVFASASWWSAVGLAQWSPALACASLVPPLGFLLAAKPNVGLAVLAASRDLRSLRARIAGAAAITALAFLVMPQWFVEWRDVVHDTPDVRPMALSLGGALLLLSVLRWRRPEARLLLSLALVPINPGLYEGVLLFLVPQSAIEAVLLALGSWIVEPLAALLIHPNATYVDTTRATGQAMLACMYLPALVMVLRRPNHPPENA